MSKEPKAPVPTDLQASSLATPNYKLVCLTFTPLNSRSLFHLFLGKSHESGGAKNQNHQTLVNEAIHSLGFPARTVVSLKQVHGNHTLILENQASFASSSTQTEADAVLTNRKDLYLTVRVADCLPIYLYDSANQVVGLIHAGWRGTLLEIAKRALSQARMRLGLNPADCDIFFGPCIKACCYEISPEVAVLFPQNSVQVRDNRFYLDLCQENHRQLIEAGIDPDKIHMADQCTCCNPEFYYSYRRTKDKSERMYAVLGLR